MLLFSHSVLSDSLGPHGLQHSRLLCPLLSPRACSNLCPLCQWCHPTISSSVVLFSFCPQSFPASGSFPISWFFTSSGWIIGASASASVLPVNIQGWFPLGLTGLISSLSKGFSRVFSCCRDLYCIWPLKVQMRSHLCNYRKGLWGSFLEMMNKHRVYSHNV